MDCSPANPLPQPCPLVPPQSDTNLLSGSAGLVDPGTQAIRTVGQLPHKPGLSAHRAYRPHKSTPSGMATPPPPAGP